MGSVIMTIKRFLTILAKNDGKRLKDYEKDIPPSPIRKKCELAMVGRLFYRVFHFHVSAKML
jgi:hypothetical protein